MAAIAPILGNIALNLALSVATSLLAGLFRPKQSLGAGNAFRHIELDLQVGEERPVGAVFGEMAVAGHLVYANNYGDADEYLQLKIDIGHGEHQGLVGVLVDDAQVTLSGSNADPKGFQVDESVVDGQPSLWVKYYTGAPGQVADAELIAQAKPAGRWTAADTSTGDAYVIVTMKTDSDYFNSSLPKFRFIWQGLKLYDWRKDSTQPGGAGAHRWADPSTWEFSKNLLVIRWNFRRGLYLNGVRVLGLGYAELFNQIAYYTAAANAADESIYDPVTDTTFARYEYAREILDSDDAFDVLNEMDAAGCGSSFSAGGADAPLVAVQQTAVMTLSDNDLLEAMPVRANKFGKVSTKKTDWQGTFTDPDNGWKPGPYGHRASASLETLISKRETRLDQPYETNGPRAQMRAEINLRKGLYPATRQESFTPKSLALELGDAVTRACEWGNVLMRVTAIEILPGRIGATLTLEEWDNTIVPASGDTFVDPTPGAGTGAPPITRTLTVSGFSVAPYARLGDGGAQIVYGEASWTLISDTQVAQVLFRVWPASGNEATDAEEFLADARLTSKKLLGPLAPETDFLATAIPVRVDGLTCTATAPFAFTTGAAITGETVPDGSIDASKLSAELDALRISTQRAVRDLEEKLYQIGLEAAEQGVSSLTETKALAAAVGVSRAYFIEQVDLVVTDVSANASAITLVEASVGDISAGGFLAFSAEVAPAGYQTQVALGVRAVVAGTVYSGGLHLLLDDSNEVFTWLDTTRFVVGPAAAPVALFDPTGAYFDTAFIQDLTADNIQVKSLDADQVLVDGTLITDLIDDQAVTLGSVTDPSGQTDFTTAEQTYQTLAFQTDNGVVLVWASIYIGWHSPAASAFGNVILRVKKNGTTISTRTVYVDDSFSGQETWFVTDDSPGQASNTYTLTVQASGSGPTIQHYGDQAVLMCMAGKK